MKKLATRLLAVLMAVALLPLTLVSTASAEEPVTITIWGSDRENMPFRNGLETIELLKERLGINIEIISAPSESLSEKYGLLMAGGDIPTIVQYTAKGLLQYKDAWENLTDRVNETDTPNLWAVYSDPDIRRKVVDSDGNITYQHDNTPVRQVVSEETSAHVRECLEYVVSDGTGRNGQVKGYRVGGKTGTADKGQTGDLVVSFVSFAPADDPQVIILVTMDTPSRSAGTSVSGGSMVAPVNSKIMADILPYLGIEPTYSAEELLGADTTVPYVIGSSVADAKSRMESRGFTCKVVGAGDTITDQTPAGGAVIPGKSTVILYAGAEKPNTMYTVPQLVGKTAAEANVAATNAGLLVRFSGATQTTSGNIRVLSQSLEAGQQVPAGTVITVQLGDANMTD